jgi:SAM-dependent methyltransferase
MPQTMVDVPSQKHFWDKWHRRRGASGLDAPHLELRNLFCAEMSAHPHGAVADLGCGQGLDALVFASTGMAVTALDFSPEAIGKVRDLAGKKAGIVAVQHDLSRPLPFGEDSFDGVYSHLALHYFDDRTTREIFAEIGRVLRPGGPFVFSVKSTDDMYFGTGDRIGPNIYCRNGHLRHFFSIEYTRDLLDDWKIDQVTPQTGWYASSKPSAFIQVVAHKPA